MVNINTSGAQSGRDFSYGASPTNQETFYELYERILSRIDIIITIKDQTSYNIELNKLRKDLKQIINKHFETSVSQLKTLDLFKNQANIQQEKLTTVKKELQLT